MRKLIKQFANVDENNKEFIKEMKELVRKNGELIKESHPGGVINIYKEYRPIP